MNNYSSDYQDDLEQMLRALNAMEKSEQTYVALTDEELTAIQEKTESIKSSCANLIEFINDRIVEKLGYKKYEEGCGYIAEKANDADDFLDVISAISFVERGVDVISFDAGMEKYFKLIHENPERISKEDLKIFELIFDAANQLEPEKNDEYVM